jgi:hypothetical protein
LAIADTIRKMSGMVRAGASFEKRRLGRSVAERWWGAGTRVKG